MSGHFLVVAALLCHRPSFEQWSEEIQNTVIKAASAATQEQRALATAEDDEILAKFNPDENEIISLSDADRALFLEVVSPLIVEQRKKFGHETLALLGL
jgi:TRAP-type C4-dicarboxylate transport system substrate-binding protein